MRSLWFVGFLGVLCLALVAAFALAGTARSGPQVGDKVPGPFQPLNVTGPDAGKKSCLVCRFGARPVVMIFAREVTPHVVELFRRIDAATAANDDKRLGSFAVICNNDGALPGQLAEFAKQQHLDHTILATYEANGPARYNLSADAEVTVVLYRHLSVKANYAFKKGELSGAELDKILADLPKILADE
jgi:hypothetical protein